MKFDYKWLEGEARDGFYVSSMMKRAWAAQLEMLQDIDKVCQENNICYFADWGTLLGAVRHRGFIPWDDDLDICMLRKDFNRFRDEVHLPECYSMLNIHTELEYEDFLNRIVNARSIPLEEEYLEKFAGFPYIAGIDVFPLDYLPRDKQRQDEIKDRVAAITERIHYLQVSEGHSEQVKRNSRKQINELFKEIEKIQSSCKSEDADEVTIMALWIKDPDYKMDKKVYSRMIRIPFEQTTICVPAYYDYLLSKKFGTFVKAVRDWDSHNFPFYVEQEETIQNAWGYTLGKYQFHESDLIRNAYESERPIDYVREMVPLWRTTFEQVVLLQERGEDSTLLQLLEKCQEIAIASGNNLDENCYDEQGKEIIHELERFCEVIYKFYQDFTQNVMNDQVVKEGKKIVERLYCLTEQFAQKRRIGILIEHREDWEKLKYIYEEALNQGNDVYVLAVPFYERDYNGAIITEHYEGKDLPKGIHLLDYNATYEINGFDVLIYTNPFDDADINASIHPFFYSDNLQKISKKIVYVDIFELDDFEDNDKRFQSTLDYYLKFPGILHADEIWVNTENHRFQYQKALTDFAGADTEERWKKNIKLNAYNQIWDEKSLKMKSGKKKMACFIDCSNLLQHGEEKISKLNEMLDIFQKNVDTLDICLFYERVSFNSIRIYDKELFTQFEEWLENAKNVIEVRDSVELNDEELKVFDAFYGDQGYLASKMIRMKRPVMIQSVDV